jgi:predicted ester cyclase
MSPDANQSLARRFFAEQDRLRGGPAIELCAPDYIAYLANNPPLSLAGHQAFASAFYAGFPDLRHNVELAIAEADRAAVRFTLLGTHTGNFLGIEPTGRSVVVTATAIMHIVEGRVAELWAEFDQLGLMRQLTAPIEATSAENGQGI